MSVSFSSGPNNGNVGESSLSLSAKIREVAMHTADGTAPAVAAALSSSSHTTADPKSKSLRLRGWAKLLTPPTALLLVSLVRGDAATARQAIDDGADINAVHKDRWNTSALHLAALHAEPECLLVMLQHCDEKPRLVPNDHGKTAMHACAKVSATAASLPLLGMIYGACPDVDVSGRNYLHDLMDNTAMSYDLLCQCTEYMLRLNGGAALLNVRDTFFMTVLDVAVNRRRPGEGELHRILLSFGAKLGRDVDTTNRDVTMVEESSIRHAISREEDNAAKQMAQWFRTRKELIEHWQRQIRRQERVAERESMQRHEIADEWKQMHAALAFSEGVERNGLAKMLQVMREDRAAVRVQCKWRQILARRISQAKKRVQLRRWAASIMIQRQWRGHKQLGMFRTFRRLMRAVVTLQRVGRGLASRRRTMRLLRGYRSLRHNAAITIWVAYRRYRCVVRMEQLEKERMSQIALWAGEAHDALISLVIKIQSIFRMRKAVKEFHKGKHGIVLAQRMWRTHHTGKANRKQMRREIAIQRIKDALRKRTAMCQMRVQLNEMTKLAVNQRISNTKLLTARLLWREAFLGLYRKVLASRNRWWWWIPQSSIRHHHEAVRQFVRAKWLHNPKIVRVVEVLRFALVVAAVVSMGIVPRGAPSFAPVANVWWYVDLVLIGTLIVTMINGALGLAWIVEMCTLIAAVLCVLLERNEGRVACGLLLFKIPLLCNQLVPEHRPTLVFCKCVELSARWLVKLSPIAIAVLVASVRAVQHDGELVSSSEGRWSSVLWHLTQPSAPLHAYYRLRRNNDTNASSFGFDSLLRSERGLEYDLTSSVPFNNATSDVMTEANLFALASSRLPIVSISILFTGLFVVVCLAVSLGVHQAFHMYYVEAISTDANDFSIKRRKKLRRSHLRQEELSSVLTMDDDVLAAKTAIEASHFDHNLGLGYHAAFDVQQLDAASNNKGNPLRSRRAARESEAQRHVSIVTIASPTSKPFAFEPPRWDLRNESPELRNQSDMKIIKAALSTRGAGQQGSTRERVLYREWSAIPLRRVSNIIILAMVALSGAFPGLYYMEVAFSLLLFLELSASVATLGIGFVLTHSNGLSLLLRLFSIVVGLVPEGSAYCVLRSARLLEGLSGMWDFSSAHQWSLAYSFLSAAICWGLGVLSLSQRRDGNNWGLNDLTASTSPIGDISSRETAFHCEGTNDCLASFTKVLLLPGIVFDGHIDPNHMPMVTCALVVMFRVLMVPFFLAVLIHPALLATSPLAIFLRLLVLKIHDEVVRSVRLTMLEGDEWFRHRRIGLGWTSASPSARQGKRRRRSEAATNSTCPSPSTTANTAPCPPLVPPSLSLKSRPTVQLDGPTTTRSMDQQRGVTPSIIAKMVLWASVARSKCASRNKCLRSTAAVSRRHDVSMPIPLLLQRSAYTSHEENLRADAPTSWNPPSAFRRYVLRSPWTYALHVVLTLLSLAFLWSYSERTSFFSFSPTTNSSTIQNISVIDIPLAALYFKDAMSSPNVPLHEVAFPLLQLLLHALSCVTAIVWIPRDVSFVVTIVSIVSLAVSLTHYNVTGSTLLYALRYLSFLRLLQLHGPVFGPIQRAAARLISNGLVKGAVPLLLFPLVVVGVVELMRSEPHSSAGRAEMMESKLAADSSVRSNFTELMVTSTDPQVLYSIYHYWILPGITIAITLFSVARFAYSAQVERIGSIALRRDNPVLAAHPFGVMWVSAGFWDALKRVGELVLLLNVAGWNLVGSPIESYDGRADMELPYWIAEVSSCGFLGLLAVLRVWVSWRKAWCAWRDRYGSTVYSSRTGDIVQIFDPKLHEAARHQTVFAFVEGLSLAYWVLTVVAAVFQLLLNEERQESFGADGYVRLGEGSYLGWIVPFRTVLLLQLIPRVFWRVSVFPRFKVLLGTCLLALVFVACATAVLAERLGTLYVERFQDNARVPLFGQRFVYCLGSFGRHLFSSLLPYMGDASWSVWASPRDVVLTNVSVAQWMSMTSTLHVEATEGLYYWTRLLFALAVSGKAFLAVLCGVALGAVCTSLRSTADDCARRRDVEDIQTSAKGEEGNAATTLEERELSRNCLPRKAAMLLDTLALGVEGIIEASQNRTTRLYGTATDEALERESKIHHRDAHKPRRFGLPEELESLRASVIRGRFAPCFAGAVNRFGHSGIPRWLLPHLLEELEICHPACQRGYMHMILELLTCLPVLDDRENKCREYCDAVDEYINGGPGLLSFATIPTYRCDDVHIFRNEGQQPTAPVRKGAIGRWGRHELYHSHVRSRYLLSSNLISPLRLVEAVAWMEAEFPSATSIGSMKWLDFCLLQRRSRASVMLQSLWRMYRCIRTVERTLFCGSRVSRVAIWTLRRRVRLMQATRRSVFLSSPSFEEARHRCGCVYAANPFAESVVRRLSEGASLMAMDRSNYSPPHTPAVTSAGPRAHRSFHFTPLQSSRPLPAAAPSSFASALHQFSAHSPTNLDAQSSNNTMRQLIPVGQHAESQSPAASSHFALHPALAAQKQHAGVVVQNQRYATMDVTNDEITSPQRSQKASSSSRSSTSESDDDNQVPSPTPSGSPRSKSSTAAAESPSGALTPSKLLKRQRAIEQSLPATPRANVPGHAEAHSPIGVL